MPMRKRYILILLVFTLFLGVGAGWGSGGAQLVRSVIAGGGGILQSGTTTIQSTIGQPVAGQMSSENGEICSGYWCLPQNILTGIRDIYLPLLMKDG